MYSSHDEYTDYDIENEYNIDIFNMYHLDEIIDLVFYIKEDLFSMLPYFLYYLNTKILIDLFILISKKESSQHFIINKNQYNLFIKEFDYEIESSLNIINKYLKKFNYKCDHKIWSLFCFKYTYLKCL